jgi:hypothetical protein
LTRRAAFRGAARLAVTGRRFFVLAAFAAGRGFRRGAAFLVRRLAARFGAVRDLGRFAELTRRVAFRLAIALVLSEP